MGLTGESLCQCCSDFEVEESGLLTEGERVDRRCLHEVLQAKESDLPVDQHGKRLLDVRVHDFFLLLLHQQSAGRNMLLSVI